MNPLLNKALAFGLGGALTLSIWKLLPGPPVAHTVVPPAENTVNAVEKIPDAQWDYTRIAEALAAVRNAQSSEERMKAVEHLMEIPPGNIEEALEQVTFPEDFKLSLEAKVLLIRWAGIDGKAATVWAWRRFASSWVWEDAFRQIGPAWAWRNPREFGTWLRDEASKAEVGEPNAKEDLGDLPVLSFELYSLSCNWLIGDEPRLAYEIMRKRGGWSMDDHKLAQGISSAVKAREALEVFSGLDLAPSRSTNTEQMIAQGILLRWQELDPEDYRKSGYTYDKSDERTDVPLPGIAEFKHAALSERAAQASRLLEGKDDARHLRYVWQIQEAWMASDPEACRDWLETLSPEIVRGAPAAYARAKAAVDLSAVMIYAGGLKTEAAREAVNVAAFDTWTAAHPGERPDFKGWSQREMSAWQDLECLGTLKTAWDEQSDIRKGGRKR